MPGNRQWVDTGIDVEPGDALSVVANGSIQFRTRARFGKNLPESFGPEGTFHFTDEESGQDFPLASAAAGPAPCFCLIGRIGDGNPFYVGKRKSWKVAEPGRLWLGINDFDTSGNRGQFVVTAERMVDAQPVALEGRLPDPVMTSKRLALQGSATQGPGTQRSAANLMTASRSSQDVVLASEAVIQPGSVLSSVKPVIPKGASVVVFYVDGLRPDVVREMVAMGHLPNIRKHFVNGGAWLSNCFTAFPSDTITSNGTMWTGCFSDRHGLKGQVRFSRRSLHSESYLEPLGPNRSARLLSPDGVDRLLHDGQAKVVDLVKGKASAKRWSQHRTTGVPPIYARLKSRGANWDTGILPMMTEVPPVLWTRSLVKHMPLLRSHEAWKYIDNANTDYAIQHLLTPNRAAASKRPVTILWLPETDSVSHKQSRGQFGSTRRTIAEADTLIGQVIDELRSQGRLNKTYFMLISDHGHHGGQSRHLSNFDIANEMFFQSRQVDENGRWVGGGLGLSVRMHRSWNRHREDGSKHFVFIDGDSDGAARIFLPKRHFRSGQWLGDSRPGDLLAYQLDKNTQRMNLLNSLVTSRMADNDGRFDFPVDLVLVKLDQSSLLIHTKDRGSAVIDRKQSDNGTWLYSYRVVTDIAANDDGTIRFQPVTHPKTDPLRLLTVLSPHELMTARDESAWLRLTIPTPYPDGVVVMTRHMLWQDNLSHREEEFAPDIVVTARPGWYFGTNSSPGTMHGYPSHDAMRATWFVSGPGIRRGVSIEVPCRLVDLTPTILELTSIPVDPKEFDGSPLRTIYERKDDADLIPISHPVYWSDVDLAAWRRISYSPLPAFEHQPLTSNHPQSPFDINNVAYNLMAIGDWRVARLFDDMLSPLSGGSRWILGSIEQAEMSVRHRGPDWAAEAVSVLDISGLSLADYSVTSLGNLDRVDSAVDWLQKQSLGIDGRLARPVGRDHLPGVPHVHRAIDSVQGAFWEVYRFGQRIVVELVDETLLNGLENRTDRTINAFRAIPAEVRVKSTASQSQE